MDIEGIIDLITNFPLRTIIVILLSFFTFILVGNFLFYHYRLIINDDTDLERKYGLKVTNVIIK
jgi:hypothetical protein